MKTWLIRPAAMKDLPVLMELEQACFALLRRCSARALRLSLRAPNQEILVVEARDASSDGGIAGAMTLRLYPRTARIFSLAVRPACRGTGLGRLLVRTAVSAARRSGRTRVSLEADLANRPLVDWYEGQGFSPMRMLTDYYGPGEHAVRMELKLDAHDSARGLVSCPGASRGKEPGEAFGSSARPHARRRGRAGREEAERGKVRGRQ